MDSQQAYRPLRLHDPRDPDPTRRRDVARIVAELADADAVLENGLWQAPFWPGHGNPETFDHLVVAEDKHEGHSLAMLGADVLRSSEEEFLLINTAFVAPVARGRRVLRRMVATVLMQAARQGPVPRVIAARSLNPAFYRAMSRLARSFGVKMYPEMGDGPVPLRAAGLARRIARRISPSCRFDPASGVLRGAVVAHGMRGVVQPAPARHAATDNGFAERLGGADQFLLVLDLRGLDTAAIIETAQRIRRRK